MPGPLPAGTEVLIGDTMGELQRLYAAADVAFIGGSLVPHGGQNLLEACAVEVNGEAVLNIPSLGGGFTATHAADTCATAPSSAPGTGSTRSSPGRR